jgi:hypothetical protein
MKVRLALALLAGQWLTLGSCSQSCVPLASVPHFAGRIQSPLGRTLADRQGDRAGQNTSGLPPKAAVCMKLLRLRRILRQLSTSRECSRSTLVRDTAEGSLLLRFTDAREVTDHGLDISIWERVRVEARHLSLWPIPHRSRIAQQCFEPSIGHIGCGGHRQTEIGALIAGAGAAQTMAGQALHNEHSLTASGRVVGWHAGVDRKPRPPPQRIGNASQARKRVGPLFRGDPRVFRMFPHEIKRSSREGFTVQVRSGMRRVFDRDPGNGAAACRMLDQVPRELRDEAISRASLDRIYGAVR